jgi:hypothetical protein
MQKKRDRDEKEVKEQDRIKKEQAAESNRKRCTICGKEFFPIRICLGHDLGGGGGSGGGGGGEEEKLNTSNAPPTFVGKLFEMAGHFGSAIRQAIEGSSPEQKSHQLSGIMFNTEIISDLLSKKVLSIDNNKASGILTIKLLCNPGEQRKELDKFIEAILTQLDGFKKDKGIVADCMKRDNEGSLYISLSPPKMYDEFIKLLARKKLLPRQVIEQQENKQAVFQEGIDHFNSTPFSTKLTYASRKNTLTDEELSKAEKQNLSKKDDKASSIRPRSPSDRPKPK